MIRQSFLYGYEITSGNYQLNFRELGDTVDRITVIPYNTYIPNDLATILEAQLNEVGNGDYSVTFDMLNRTFSISNGTTVFSVLPSSTTSSAWSVLGFSNDLSGLQDYTGEQTGILFKPQLPLFNLNDFEYRSNTYNGSVSISTSGLIRSSMLGRYRSMTCDIRYINNKDNKISPVLYNSNAVDETKDFLEWAINKKAILYFNDDKIRTKYFKCVLRKTSESSDGLGYLIKEMSNLPEFYEVTGLEFWEQ